MPKKSYHKFDILSPVVIPFYLIHKHIKLLFKNSLDSLLSGRQFQSLAADVLSVARPWWFHDNCVAVDLSSSMCVLLRPLQCLFLGDVSGHDGIPALVCFELGKQPASPTFSMKWMLCSHWWQVICDDFGVCWWPCVGQKTGAAGAGWYLQLPPSPGVPPRAAAAETDPSCAGAAFDQPRTEMSIASLIQGWH